MLIALFTLTFCLIVHESNAQQCVDENGNPVDWFALYKLPKILNHPIESVQKGVAYLYVTSDTVDQGWTLANTTITDSESILGKTLSILIGNDVEDIFWILYNDAPPDKPEEFKQGHTKGLVVGSRDKGFWLVHSVPRFPLIDRERGYVYPHSGTMYGQNFLCVSVSQRNLDDIGIQLMVNDANVFESSFQGTLDNLFPHLKNAADMQRLKITNHELVFQSAGNLSFLSFAKSREYDKDLYSDWLSDALKCELLVETWMHDDKIPSVCNITYPVHNIEEIKWPVKKIDFSSFKDHSKWAISAVKNKPWICIGDINRATTQFVRGGGTVCLNNADLWSIYYNMVTALEPCPAT